MLNNKRTKATSFAANAPRIAIVGCGAITESFYLPVLAKHPSVLQNLVLVDRNVARGRELTTAFKVKDALVDYHELLNAAVDGVIVATPSHLHYSIAMDFLARGVHVMCEKPLAETAREAREMVEEARKTGAVLMTNNKRRRYASFLKVKELLANKTFGEPISLKYYEGGEFDWPTVSGFYFNTQVSSKGLLLDRGAHVLDSICWWLGGKPTLISSQNDAFGGREALAYVNFEHRMCRGEVKLSMLSKFPCIYEIKCEAGTIEGDVFDFQSLVVSPKSGSKKRLVLKTSEKTLNDFSCTMVTNFLDVVSKGEQPFVSGEQVLDSLEFIGECYQAAGRFKMPWYEMMEVAIDR